MSRCSAARSKKVPGGASCPRSMALTGSLPSKACVVPSMNSAGARPSMSGRLLLEAAVRPGPRWSAARAGDELGQRGVACRRTRRCASSGRRRQPDGDRRDRSRRRTGSARKRRATTPSSADHRLRGRFGAGDGAVGRRPGRRRGRPQPPPGQPGLLHRPEQGLHREAVERVDVHRRHQTTSTGDRTSAGIRHGKVRIGSSRHGTAHRAEHPAGPACGRPLGPDEQRHRQPGEQRVRGDPGDVGDEPLTGEQVAPGAVGQLQGGVAPALGGQRRPAAGSRPATTPPRSKATTWSAAEPVDLDRLVPGEPLGVVPAGPQHPGDDQQLGRAGLVDRPAPRRRPARPAASGAAA